MLPNLCLTREILLNWIQGNLSDSEADVVLDHLDECEDCESALSVLQSDRALGAFDNERDYRSEPECTAIIKMLAKGRPAPTPAVTVVGFDDLSGHRIRDYQLIEPLGRGGMGTVYLAHHTRLNKSVAVKLLPEHSQEDAANIERFEREMRAVGQLDHANIVAALDAGDADGRYFLTMELLDGIDLSRCTKNKKQLTVTDACEVVRQAAIGMQYAHDQGLIHRDLKPSNLMLVRNSDGSVTVKILDLGLALMPDADGAESELTDHSMLIGTLHYMAPEQSEDTHGISNTADVYSLGATLYRLLTGVAPFHGPAYSTPAKRLAALACIEPPLITELRDDVPDVLATLINSMLQKDPGKRPGSMSEVARTIAPFAADAELRCLLQDDSDAQSRDSHGNLATTDTAPPPSQTVLGPKRTRTKEEDGVELAQSPPVKGFSRYVLAAGIPIAFIIAAVIWLKTDGGYIRIEHDPSIQLTVEIKRNEKTVADYQLRRESESLFYESGEYEISIPANQQDVFELRNGVFTLNRGGSAVVSISRRTTKNAVSHDHKITPAEIAKWVLERGGRLATKSGDLNDVSRVPPEAFDITSIAARNCDQKDVETLAGWLQHVPTCSRLSLQVGPFSEANVAAIARLKQVDHLVAGSDTFTDRYLQTLSQTLPLRSLSLIRAAVTTKGLRHVQSNCRSLKSLTIYSTVLFGDGLSPIADIENLRTLELSLISKQTNGKELSPLTASKIETLKLRGKWLTGFAKAIVAMPGLQALELQKCVKLKDADLLQLAHAGGLRTLTLSGNSLLTVDGIQNFANERSDVILFLEDNHKDIAQLLEQPNIQKLSSLPGEDK